MGKVVGVFGTAHILFDTTDVEDKAERVFDGMQEIGRRIRETKPDIIVVITGDHMFNIAQASQIPLCVGVADEWEPFGDLRTGKRPFPGHRGLAEAFVERAHRTGFDLTKAEGLKPDHGVTLPLRFITPDNDVPVVPILINMNMAPLPEPSRCFALGEVLRETIERDVGPDVRVAIVATGGLSHWLFVPRMGEINEPWDRDFLNRMVSGQVRELATMTARSIVEDAGNGGIEVVAWIMAGATLPDRKGEEIYYEPIAPWSTGLGGLAITA